MPGYIKDPDLSFDTTSTLNDWVKQNVKKSYKFNNPVPFPSMVFTH